MKSSLSFRRLLIALVAFALLSQSVFAQKPALSSVEQRAASRLNVKTIRDVTVALASPAMEGRGTGQPGADRAALYLADRFKKLGLRPAGDNNTYLQSIRFKVERALPESTFKAGETVFRFREDFVIAPPLPAESKKINGAMALVGYGVVSPEIKRDDLAGIDVKGKVAVLFDGKPEKVDDATWAKASNQQIVFTRLISKGAVGFVIVYTGSPARPYSLISSYLARRRVSLADSPQMPFKIPPIIIVGQNAAERLFSASGISFAEARQKAEQGEVISRELNQQVAASIQIKREEVTSSNVIGLLEGADAKLKEEALVYTAHYDAYGKDWDGTIYPGAGDNAVGVAKLIAVAEAMSKMKPRRSILFIALTGEEHGLLGAEHWVNHPTWTIEKVAANINFDGIGTDVWGKLGLIIDLGFNHSDLGALIKDVTAAYRIEIAPDPAPEEGFFYRSDHYAFFKKGIPALYLTGGPGGNRDEMWKRAGEWLATHYHMATDTVQADWRWEGARTLAALGLTVGMRIADRQEMPAWLPTSPYNRPRGTKLPPPARQ
ncbi:MAG: M28 family peptidase [Acidobacteriota bacterium]